MDTLTSTVAVMATGLLSIIVGTLARAPLRLTALCVGGAFIIGPLAHLANEEFLRIAGAGVAIGLALVAIVNSATALIRWKIQSRHS